MSSDNNDIQDNDEKMDAQMASDSVATDAAVAEGPTTMEGRVECVE